MKAPRVNSSELQRQLFAVPVLSRVAERANSTRRARCA